MIKGFYLQEISLPGVYVGARALQRVVGLLWVALCSGRWCGQQKTAVQDQERKLRQNLLRH